MTAAPVTAFRSFKVIPLLAALVCLLWVGVPRSAFGEAPAFDPAKLNPVNAEDYKETIRVACVGDSITFGAGVKDRDHNSYPVQLGKLLGELRNDKVAAAPLHKRTSSWDRIWVFWLIGALFGADWYLRRRWGLA